MVKVIITVRYRDLTGRYRCIAPYFISRVHIVSTAEKESYIVHLTLRTSFHGKPYFFALLHKYQLFICSLERSERAESGMSRTFEKMHFLAKL